MTVAEVASLTRVSKMTVYRLVRSGEIDKVRIGRSFRIPRAAVRAYLDRYQVAAHAQDDGGTALTQDVAPGQALDPEEARSVLGEGLHTALRRAGSTGHSITAYRAIEAMPEGEWGSILDFVIDGMSLMGLWIVRTGETP